MSDPTSLSKDWPFGFEGYDKEMHASISKTVEQGNQKSLHELINLNTQEDETKLWPKAEWGPQSKPGLLRVFARTLGKYEEHFVEKITEVELKTMKSVSELFDAITKVNHELATLARTLTAKKSQYHKPPSLEEAFQQVSSGAYTETIAPSQPSWLARGTTRLNMAPLWLTQEPTMTLGDRSPPRTSHK